MTIIRPTIAARDRALMGPRAPAALPWEDAGGGTSQTALLQSFVSGLNGWWFDWRTGIAIGTGVSSWTDRVQGFVVSQATGSKQPVYSGAGIVFDGVDDFLGSASNPANGKSAMTGIIVGSLPAWAGGTPVMLWWGSSGAGVRFLAYANGATNGLSTYCESPAATTNEWKSLSTSMPSGVYTFQADLAQGTAATTAVLKNGTSLGGSPASSGAVSGTFTTGSGFQIGAQNGTTPANLTALAVVLLPTVANANNVGVASLLRGIYGV